MGIESIKSLLAQANISYKVEKVVLISICTPHLIQYQGTRVTGFFVVGDPSSFAFSINI